MTRLALLSCDSVDGARLAAALEACPRLEHLTLEGCGVVASLTLRLPRLRVATLVGCRVLRVLDVTASRLETLTFEPQAPGLAAAQQLRALTLRCDALRRLELRALPALVTLRLAAPALRALAAVECDALSARALAAALSGTAPAVVPAAAPPAAAPAAAAALHGAGAGGAGGAGLAGHGAGQGHHGGGHGPLGGPLGGLGDGGGDGVFGGGAPALEELRLEACGALGDLRLSHPTLRAVGASACPALRSLSLAAPQLARVDVDECAELRELRVSAAARLEALALGACGALEALALDAPRLASLDLRGCARLARLELACPALKSVDATFCGALPDAALAALAAGGGGCGSGGSHQLRGPFAAASATAVQQQRLALLPPPSAPPPSAPPPPPVEHLALSACPQITAAGLGALAALTRLRRLDLAYSSLASAAPLFAACGGLTALGLASCGRLDADSLLALVDGGGGAVALPHLRELDLSYCSVPPRLVAALLLRATRLSALALNGVDGVTAAAWRALAGAAGAGIGPAEDGGKGGSDGCWQRVAGVAPAPAGDAEQGSGCGIDVDGAGDGDRAGGIESLSLVRCARLRTLCIGVMPARPLGGPFDAADDGDGGASASSNSISSSGSGIRVMALSRAQPPHAGQPRGAYRDRKSVV